MYSYRPSPLDLFFERDDIFLARFPPLPRSFPEQQLVIEPSLLCKEMEDRTRNIQKRFPTLAGIEPTSSGVFPLQNR